MATIIEWLDLSIKAAAVVGGMLTAGIALYTLRVKRREQRYEFLENLRRDFLGDEFLTQREKVVQGWSACIEVSDGKSPLPEEIAFLAAQDDEAVREFLDKHGLKVLELGSSGDGDRAELIASTNAVLNRYEHLGKLIDARVISKRIARTFFYTMVGDTFLACMPWIMHRRREKPQYAQRMQEALRVVPNISKNWNRV